MLSQRTWEAALGALQVEVPKADFAAWFRDARFVRAGGREIVVAVPTVFAKEIVTRRYRELVARAVSKAHGGDVDVTFVVQAGQPAGPPAWLADPPPSPTPRPDPAAAPNARLNQGYTFYRFMVGSSNRLAHAAALRVSERPGDVYNPLFLYSGVGLGKTHLLHAVGHAVLARRPDTRMRYVPCETFVNDLLHAIRTESRGDRRRRFRERYRTVDLLMVDDVEFLSRTEASQEEMFHTFNAIYEAGGQIVLTSDRPPREIARLEARLRSRFEVGLVADIQAPDLDLRRMILHQQAVAAAATVPDDTIDCLADRVTRNVRELEGALAAFGLDVAGLRCCDVGASTGGFTDCLLQHGAAEVVAVDVGRAQMHERLADDPRVTLLERTDIRDVDPASIGAPFDLVTADVSFISLTSVMERLAELASTSTPVVVLVKPQFEVGRKQAGRGRGVIRDPKQWQAALDRVLDAAPNAGLAPQAAAPSVLKGAQGNVEFFLRLEKGGTPAAVDSSQAVTQVVAEGG